MARRPLRPGDEIWLVPTLPTAPSAAYRYAAGEVIDVHGVRVRVRLLDGTVLTTDVANISLSLPTEREPMPRLALRRPERPMVMPPGWSEQTLW